MTDLEKSLKGLLGSSEYCRDTLHRVKPGGEIIPAIFNGIFFFTIEISDTELNNDDYYGLAVRYPSFPQSLVC